MVNEIITLAERLGVRLSDERLMLVTAESCTGGLVAAMLTEVPGSSNWFERGLVTYSDAAKVELLGVDKTLLEKYGAVSEYAVRAMAEGAVAHSQAQLGLAITGVAGPTGGSQDKPAGTVWFAWVGAPIGQQAQMRIFSGDRRSVRLQATQFALSHLLSRLTTYYKGK